MALRRTLDALAGELERASAVPLSSSCLVNRAEMLSLVERARTELATEIEGAALVVKQRDDLLDDARREAQELVEAARRQAGELVAVHSVVTGARARAGQILDAARVEAARLLRDADDYCERRLAGLETDLWATLGQVRRGRQRLQERSGLAPGARDGRKAPDTGGIGDMGDIGDAAAEEAERHPEHDPVRAGLDAGREDGEGWSAPPSPRRVVDLATLERQDTSRGRQ